MDGRVSHHRAAYSTQHATRSSIQLRAAVAAAAEPPSVLCRSRFAVLPSNGQQATAQQGPRGWLCKPRTLVNSAIFAAFRSQAITSMTTSSADTQRTHTDANRDAMMRATQRRATRMLVGGGGQVTVDDGPSPTSKSSQSLMTPSTPTCDSPARKAAEPTPVNTYQAGWLISWHTTSPPSSLYASKNASIFAVSTCGPPNAPAASKHATTRVSGESLTAPQGWRTVVEVRLQRALQRPAAVL